jgi:hypothetical protein
MINRQDLYIVNAILGQLDIWSGVKYFVHTKNPHEGHLVHSNIPLNLDQSTNDFVIVIEARKDWLKIREQFYLAMLYLPDVQVSLWRQTGSTLPEHLTWLASTLIEEQEIVLHLFPIDNSIQMPDARFHTIDVCESTDERLKTIYKMEPLGSSLLETIETKYGCIFIGSKETVDNIWKQFPNCMFFVEPDGNYIKLEIVFPDMIDRRTHAIN